MEVWASKLGAIEPRRRLDLSVLTLILGIKHIRSAVLSHGGGRVVCGEEWYATGEGGEGGGEERDKYRSKALFGARARNQDLADPWISAVWRWAV